MSNPSHNEFLTVVSTLETDDDIGNSVPSYYHLKQHPPSPATNVMSKPDTPAQIQCF